MHNRGLLTRFVFDPATGTGTSQDFVLANLPGLRGSQYAAQGLTGVFPHFLTIGTDGNLWGSGLNDVIFKFDLTTFQATYFRNGITPGSTPHGILQDPTNPDFFWFAEEGEEIFPEPGGGNKSELGQSRLARFQVSTGQIVEYTGGLEVGERLHGFNFDVDGNLWVGLEGPDQVARFDRATGLFTDFVQFPRGTGPHSLYAGPPGDIHLYVVLQDSNQIGIFNPRTKRVEDIISIPGLRVDIPFGRDEGVGDGSSIVQIVPGPEGRSLWITEFLNDRVARLDLVTHQVTEYFAGITPNASPLNIVVGRDGNIWFSEPMLDRSQRGRIARLVVTEVSTPTTTTLTSDINLSVFGQSVTFTATVTSTGPTPTGTVTFRDGSTALGSSSLSGGIATFSIDTLAVGTHTITAVYGGDSNNNPSNSAQVATVTVLQANTQVILTRRLVRISRGMRRIDLVTTVLAAPPGGGVPTGTVTYYVSDYSVP